MRILFLHGMFCPPQGYEVDLMPGFLQKLRQRDFQITFIESQRESKSTPPMPVESIMPSQVGRIGHLPEWYNANNLDDGSGLKSFDGLSDALDQLRTLLNKEEPFDIIMGHSQGAQLAAILTLMIESDPNWLSPKHKHWKGIVCLNAPNPFDTEATLADQVKAHGKLCTPSLHVYGDKDFSLENSKKMRLIHFGNGNEVQEFTYSGGHFLPKDDKLYNQLVDIICNMVS